jgi:hypothetical protein
MPRLIPVLAPDQIGNKGEREVYTRLRDQLPDDWIVRYHYPACWMHGTCLRECEADFIVIAPRRGLLFIEVKSSSGYDCVDGVWCRIGPDGIREPTKNPFEQATSTKHRIVDRLSKDLFCCGKDKFPGIYGHLVAYPFAKVEGRLPRSIDPRLMVAYKEMDRLLEKIEEAFELWGDSNLGERFTPDAANQVAEYLSDRCNFVSVLAGDVDEDEAVLKRLTMQQYQSFKAILSNPRILTKGPAGSGKTMIALWGAQAMAERGRRVLVICFNRLLARWLQHTCDDRNVTIRSFFSLCRERVTKGGVRFDVPREKDEQLKFWGQTAPELFNQALSNATEDDQFDAVFVDEAQDFHANWWIPVQLLLKDPDAGPLFLFFDPDQAGVYGHGDQYPEKGMVRFDLTENCRNTQRITKYCGSILTREIKSFELCPIGVKPQILGAVADPSHRAQNVRRLVSNLLGEGFHPSRIAILSPWDSDTTFSSLNYLSSVNNVQIITDPENFNLWLTGQGIWGGTIKAFKGLEADCVIVSDIPAQDSKAFTLADLYVASSRAKHRLAFVPSSVEAEGNLKAWAETIRDNSEP